MRVYTARHILAPMKQGQMHFRVEPSLHRFLKSAAEFDHKSLSAFMVHAAIQYAETLKARGWKAKDAPQVRDGRRRAAA